LVLRKNVNDNDMRAIETLIYGIDGKNIKRYRVRCLKELSFLPKYYGFITFLTGDEDTEESITAEFSDSTIVSWSYDFINDDSLILYIACLSDSDNYLLLVTDEKTDSASPYIVNCRTDKDRLEETLYAIRNNELNIESK